MRKLIPALVVGMASLCLQPASAQAAWPAKPIRIVVPATPGGAIDLAARVIGARLTESLGQPVVVDNKPGAAGIAGSDVVAKAPADGYTFGLVASSHAINASLYPRLPYDTARDFMPAALPDVPTVAEGGVSGYETSTWGGLVAPAGTPREIVARLNAEVNRILRLPEVRERLAAAGCEPGSGSAEDFARFIASETTKWGAVIKASGATAVQ